MITDYARICALTCHMIMIAEYMVRLFRARRPDWSGGAPPVVWVWGEMLHAATKARAATAATHSRPATAQHHPNRRINAHRYDSFSLSFRILKKVCVSNSRFGLRFNASCDSCRFLDEFFHHSLHTLFDLWVLQIYVVFIKPETRDNYFALTCSMLKNIRCFPYMYFQKFSFVM